MHISPADQLDADINCFATYEAGQLLRRYGNDGAEAFITVAAQEILEKLGDCISNS
ncbi:hypothetical protein [Hymenobacter yonginensis]|uniref:Uncharacterized protein n=1 Tax=Hymenobacter yonginensis TaxID=748197 RepID=A0ABY7PKF4_9BACT|nr:hypothetical protein [Hymenobacter yonginensis]WBO83176.1 hypothetical protein O9Z63_12385 [Hymenobacter yonginensis]